MEKETLIIRFEMVAWWFMIALALLSEGCATPAYYPGTSVQHLSSIPCDANNCGKRVWK